jgi:Sigma-70, region 4/Anti-sigma-K factor rskA
MSRLDDLPPDQRAVLLLLVRQGKSHAEIADMLGIPQSAVRNRARAALDALAAQSGEIHGAAHQQAGDSPRQAGTSVASSLPSSKRGGALLLAALVVIVVVAVILITSGGGSNKTSSTQASTTTPSATKTSGTSSTSTSTSTSSTSKPTVDKQIALTSPEPGSKTIGLVEVLSESSKHAIYLAAEHLPSPPAGSFYAVWLSNSPTSSTPLGKTPTVGSNGRLEAGTLLPTNAGDYHQILLTRETNSRATHPGPTVLSGSFSLGGH